MSLIADFIKEDDNGQYGGYPTHDETGSAVGAQFVDHRIVNETRWGHIVEYVYKRDNEYVKVTYESASGDGETEYIPEYENVFPKEITVTKYLKVVD